MMEVRRDWTPFLFLSREEGIFLTAADLNPPLAEAVLSARL